ncbi:uncharacterized protein F4822DRAFT_391267 [Hypoxylon trugodes]|uniref:uncharacterized protein n=1 Tax=Hypoxylon trugodes TaxID=326681 RepID=UPI00219015FD|nr:uncharacterized protein F4822DRAFT_391267 [Hypoxylon trugodes]KAI1392504.1 hypothetical protein F4822DRAFT_391267 [Hypoxylon trugodes]
MHFLTVITLASAALAVPFQPFKKPVGTGSIPSFPTVPGTAPTGGPTAFPALADPTSVYHPSITYATTTASSSQGGFTPAPNTFSTFQATRLPETSSIFDSVPTPPVNAKQVDAPHPFPTFPGGTAPPTQPSSGLPPHHHHHDPTGGYSGPVSFTRTTPLPAPSAFWGA